MRKSIIRILIAILLVLLDGVMMLAVKGHKTFFFPLYRRFSQSFYAVLSKLSAGVKIAVWDIGMVVLVVLLIGTLIHVLRRKKSFLAWFSHVLLVVSLLLCEVVNGWMLNHYAPKLSGYLNLEVRQYSYEELQEATIYYLMQAAAYAPFVNRDEEGHLVRGDFYALAEQAGQSYVELEETYPVFHGSSVRVKGLSVIGEYLMYNGIIGMFMPITGEAGVPFTVPSAPLPFTMCHEAAHRLGIASEQEANFCAFLASIHNEDPYFIYSGYYEAFGYCYNSLYGEGPEEAYALLEPYLEDPLVQLVLLDRADTRAVYKKYESKLQKTSDRVNDTYLKLFDQKSGIKSYGEVTDYLLAWYLAATMRTRV